MKAKPLILFESSYNFLFVVLLMSLPFSIRVTNITIVVIFAYWLFFDRNRKIRDFKTLFFLVTLFFVYLVGTIYSKNLPEALFGLEKRLPLLAFPLIFSGISITEKQKKYLLIVFITSLVIAMICCLGWEGFAHYRAYGRLYPTNFDYFKLSELTQITQLEPPYFGLYIGSALLFLSFLFQRGEISFSAFLGLSLFFITFMLFSGARTAIIASAISLSVFWIIQKGFKTVLILMVFISLIVIVVFNDTVLRGRFTEAMTLRNPHETGSYSSLSLRLAKWNSAVSVIKSNLFFGVGTGDHQEALNKSYLENNLNEAYEQKYNAHNQYLDIAIALGLMGLLGLLATFGVCLYHSLIRKDWLYFSFILFFSICILTESMLERQKGIVFFSFFNSLLVFFPRKGDIQNF